MAKSKAKTDTPPDPDALVRQAAGTYRTGDDRFEVRQADVGWFLVDSTQSNEFGQELIHGPFATLKAVREAIPGARGTKTRPLPKPARPKAKAKAKAKAEKAEPAPRTWIDELPTAEARSVRRLIAALESEGITGAEALVRWDHPRRGRLSPDAFIGIAEETGLIVQLGQWVLEEACQQLRTWQLTLPADAALSMSVNLSVRQLEQASIVDAVRDVVDQFALDPKTITLEITETVVIDHMEDDRSRLVALKDLGVQIALDDFGTGYSSLRYADDLPVDVLKVDRSFVAGITDTEPTPVLEAIVALAGRLGVHTVAEGIENPNQITALKAIGCDLGQGYWFSPPVPPDAFADLLTRNLSSGGFDTSGQDEATKES